MTLDRELEETVPNISGEFRANLLCGHVVSEHSRWRDVPQGPFNGFSVTSLDGVPICLLEVFVGAEVSGQAAPPKSENLILGRYGGHDVAVSAMFAQGDFQAGTSSLARFYEDEAL